MKFHYFAPSAFAFSITATLAFAQQAPMVPPPMPNLQRLETVIHTVADLDRAVAFYRDAFGLEITTIQNKPAADKFNETVTATKGAKTHTALLKIPGAEFDLELIEYQGVQKTPGEWAMQKPGNINLNFRVRDIAATLAAVKRGGATPVTTGGEPLKRGGRNGNSNLSIFMKDPDGFVFEMEQFFPEGPTTVPADSKVLTAGLGMTISDGEKSIAFYKSLGFTTRLGNAFSAPSSDVGMALLGTEGAQLRASSVGVPEGKLALFCFELHGVEGAAPHHKPQDPGAGGSSCR